MPGLLDDLLERGFSLDPAVVIKEYVQEHITAFSFGRVRIDWLKPVLPFYCPGAGRRQPLAWSEGHSVRVATAEGLILTKMVAFRPQDQIDIETLLTANRDTIDIASSARNGPLSRRRSRSARHGSRPPSPGGSSGGSESGLPPFMTEFTSLVLKRQIDRRRECQRCRGSRLGTFSDAADRRGQFHQWTQRQ